MKAGIDYIGVGVGAIILSSKKDLFLTKRGKKSRNEVGKWEFPGGAVHFGETLKKALKREVREEFGIEIDIGELFDVNDHLIPDEKQHWVSAVFFAKIKKGKLRILEPEKCDAVGWFALRKISKLPLSIITRSEVKKLKANSLNGHPWGGTSTSLRWGNSVVSEEVAGNVEKNGGGGF